MAYAPAVSIGNTSVTFRSIANVALLLIASFVVAGSTIALATVAPAIIFIASLVLVLVVWALVVELLGVRIDGGWLTMPRKTLRMLPFLAVRRVSIRLTEIDSVIVEQPRFGVETATIRTLNAEKFRATFTNRDARRDFVQALREANPSIDLMK